jgi:hypothetical protein
MEKRMIYKIKDIFLKRKIINDIKCQYLSYNGNTKEALSIYLEGANSDEFNNMGNILSDIKKVYRNRNEKYNCKN